ncbi:hypothetical protein SBA3_370033 [Candidatus Sulfopaludibacter sp. SbA3]|nr:hypothetical protein SBA3_370033 [Candidatus Sulfopaludibacter sp. SbA3]
MRGGGRKRLRHPSRVSIDPHDGAHVKSAAFANDHADGENGAAIDHQADIRSVGRQLEGAGGGNGLAGLQEGVQWDLGAGEDGIVSFVLSVEQVDIFGDVFALGNAAGAAKDAEADVIEHDRVFRRPLDAIHGKAPIVAALRVAHVEHGLPGESSGEVDDPDIRRGAKDEHAKNRQCPRAAAAKGRHDCSDQSADGGEEQHDEQEVKNGHSFSR